MVCLLWLGGFFCLIDVFVRIVVRDVWVWVVVHYGGVRVGVHDVCRWVVVP